MDESERMREFVKGGTTKDVVRSSFINVLPDLRRGYSEGK